MSASILIVSADSLIVLEVGQVGLVGPVRPVGDTLGGLGADPQTSGSRALPLMGEVEGASCRGLSPFLPLSRLFIIFAP